MYSFKEEKKMNKMDKLIKTIKNVPRVYAWSTISHVEKQKRADCIQQIIQLINENKDEIKNDDGTLINYAIFLGNVGILKLLFKYSIDPNKCFEIYFEKIDDGENDFFGTFDPNGEFHEIFHEFGVKDTILISPLCYALLTDKVSFSIIKTIVNHGGNKIFYLNPLTKVQILYDANPDYFNNNWSNNFLGVDIDLICPVRDARIYDFLKKNIYEKKKHIVTI